MSLSRRDNPLGGLSSLRGLARRAVGFAAGVPGEVPAAAPRAPGFVNRPAALAPKVSAQEAFLLRN